MSDNTRSKISNHDIISSYFIGPMSENMPDFKRNILAILEAVVQTRKEYSQPGDTV